MGKALKRFRHQLSERLCPDCAEPLIEHVPVLSKLDQPYFVCMVCDRTWEPAQLEAQNKSDKT